jgi:hypothetical protein
VRETSQATSSERTLEVLDGMVRGELEEAADDDEALYTLSECTSKQTGSLHLIIGELCVGSVRL